ncbi:MAG: DHHA1 domain-containing protein [Polaromonas sp.]
MKTILPLQLLHAPDRHDPQPLVIYHGRRCPDGFGAALAAWLFYEGQAEFLALDHGDIQSVDQLPQLDGRAVYILDFSFSAEILRGIDERAAKLVMLDHHKSAAEKLTGFACRCGVVHFDMNKSGARLAWEFFHPEAPVPGLVRFIEDRDIWVWQYPESAGFLAALDMEPFDFARWADIARFSPAQLTDFMARGQAMDEKFSKLAADMVEGARPLSFNGHQGLMVNAPGVFHSLIGNLLSAQSMTFALMWTVGKDGVVKVGLRSQRNFDCIPLAESMGGGGHAQACGFKMGVARLPELLGGVFEAATPTAASEICEARGPGRRPQAGLASPQ